MVEKLTNFDKLNNYLLKIEKLKHIYSYLITKLPGKEIEYTNDFTFNIFYYYYDEEPNKEFLLEECNTISKELELPIAYFELFDNGITINI